MSSRIAALPRLPRALCPVWLAALPVPHHYHSRQDARAFAGSCSGTSSSRQSCVPRQEQGLPYSSMAGPASLQGCCSSRTTTATITSSSSSRWPPGSQQPGCTQLFTTTCSSSLHHGHVSAHVLACAAVVSEEPTCVRCHIPRVTGDTAEVLCDFLLGFDAQSVLVEESRLPGEAEQQIFGTSEDLWDNCSVTAYFALEHDVDATLQMAEELVGIPLTWSLEPVVNRDWVDQIKASYVPQNICQGLWVVPTWSQPTDESALNVILEPGVAFGTGEHPTTSMCLQQLMAWGSTLLGGTRVLDYGAGSGVLAITALKLGATAAAGTDTDPLAVKSAARNAQLNGCSSSFTSLQCSPHLGDPEPLQQAGLPAVAAFDLVMANILRGPLLELQPRLSSYCRPGGRLMLSGILQEQAPEIQKAYDSSFTNFQMTTCGSWAMLTAVKK